MGLFQIHSFAADETDPGFDQTGEVNVPGTPMGPAGREPVSGSGWRGASQPPEAPAGIGISHLNVLLVERERQLATTARRASDLQRRLMQLAEAVCPAAVDDECRRNGQALESWPSERLIDFISENGRERLLRADQALRQYTTLQKAYAALLEEKRQWTETKPLDEAVGLGTTSPSKIEPEAGHAVPSPPEGHEPAPAPASGQAAPKSQARESTPAPKVDPARLDDMVRLIATTGLVRANRIREKLSALWGIDRRGSVFSQIVEAAVAAGYLGVKPVRCDWPGAPAHLMELTEQGQAQARRLGCHLTPPEGLEGTRRGLPAEIISLVLQAAELLQANGYTDVCPFPNPIALPDGATYNPALSAKDQTAATVYIECEREHVLLPRDERWRLAARVGGGIMHLITTTQAIQDRLTTEVNLVRVHASFRLLALNVNDCLKGRRGSDGSIWLYQR